MSARHDVAPRSARHGVAPIVWGLVWALVFDVFLVGGCWIAVQVFPNEGGKACLAVLGVLLLLGAGALLCKRGESR